MNSDMESIYKTIIRNAAKRIAENVDAASMGQSFLFEEFITEIAEVLENMIPLDSLLESLEAMSDFKKSNFSKKSEAALILAMQESYRSLIYLTTTPVFCHAGGDVVCVKCGKKYCDHPKDFAYKPLVKLCDGTLVKL